MHFSTAVKCLCCVPFVQILHPKSELATRQSLTLRRLRLRHRRDRPVSSELKRVGQRDTPRTAKDPGSQDAFQHEGSDVSCESSSSNQTTSPCLSRVVGQACKQAGEAVRSIDRAVIVRSSCTSTFSSMSPSRRGCKEAWKACLGRRRSACKRTKVAGELLLGKPPS